MGMSWVCVPPLANLTVITYVYTPAPQPFNHPGAPHTPWWYLKNVVLCSNISVAVLDLVVVLEHSIKMVRAESGEP